MNQALHSVATPLAQTRKLINRYKDGVLTARAEGDFEGAFATLRDDLQSMGDSLCKAMCDVSDAAQELNAAALASHPNLTELVARRLAAGRNRGANHGFIARNCGISQAKL